MKAMLNIKLLLVVFSIGCFFGPITKGQQTNFIYIQADHNQPFFVITNNKTYQSSEVGYLIIPRLAQGKHDLTIGFPDNSFPAQKFSITIDKRDLGFALKNMEEKGWALASVHNKELIYGTGATNNDIINNNPDSVVETKIPAKEDKKTPVKSTAFGQMLAEVVNDPTILQPTVLPDHPVTYYKGEMQALDQFAGESHETARADVETVQTDAADSNSSALNEPFESSTKGIIKVSQKDNKEGTDLVFIDFKDFTNDTIRVFIPSDKTVENNVPVESEKSVVVKNDSPGIGASGKKNGNEPGFIDMNANNKEAGKKVNNPFFANEKPENTVVVKEEKANDEKTGIQSNAVVNANCNKMIAEVDVEKLKKRMISLDNAEMVKAAKKALKGKCITTQQVSDLSGLFLSDEGRYNFYDAIYPFVYDTGNYRQLEEQLLDIYYKNRFKALIGY